MTVDRYRSGWKISYCQTIEKLLEIRPIENPDGTTEPHTLTLSGEAFREWRDFYMTIEHDLADGGRFEHCRDWAGKTPGRAARLAGLLHCAMNPVKPWRYPVSRETMEQALDITAVSISHALAVFNLMGADPAIEKRGPGIKMDQTAPARDFHETSSISRPERDIYQGGYVG